MTNKENENIKAIEESDLDDFSKDIEEFKVNVKEKEAHVYGVSSKVRWMPIALLTGFVLAIGMGFYKLLVYGSPDDYGDPINAYVGGDSYNYIINGTYATAYFVLAGSFLLAAIGLEILHAIKENTKAKRDVK